MMTNAHVILEEAHSVSKTAQATEQSGLHLLCLSAKTDAALVSLARLYLEMLINYNHSLKDLCYTSSLCREHMKCRLILSATTIVDLAYELQAFVQTNSSTLTFNRENILVPARVWYNGKSETPKVIFLYFILLFIIY